MRHANNETVLLRTKYHHLSNARTSSLPPTPWLSRLYPMFLYRRMRSRVQHAENYNPRTNTRTHANLHLHPPLALYTRRQGRTGLKMPTSSVKALPLALPYWNLRWSHGLVYFSTLRFTAFMHSCCCMCIQAESTYTRAHKSIHTKTRRQRW